MFFTKYFLYLTYLMRKEAKWLLLKKDSTSFLLKRINPRGILVNSLVPLPDSETMKRIATICGVSIDYLIGHTDERQPGTNFKTINNPTVLNFVKMIASELQLNNNLSEKDCQEILEDLTEYSRFKLQQKIKNHHVNHS
ncbi:MAG: hypothetical protein H6Q69_3180 [Firmicutes bacterium]|nr:hypothetical protein [Bacillota bacterium]